MTDLDSSWRIGVDRPDDIIGYAGPGLAFEVSSVHRVLTHALEYAHALIWEDTGTSIVSCNIECAIHDD